MKLKFKRKISTQSTVFLAILLSLLILAVAYEYLNKEVSIFELTFAEHSNLLGESGGAVLPASCSSNPPTNHSAGDCPPLVYVGIRSSNNSVGATITGVAGASFTGSYYYTTSGVA
ncbi:MAG: hypothetical protein R3B53_03805 [Candidatus Paceibacterota bacterium]